MYIPIVRYLIVPNIISTFVPEKWRVFYSYINNNSNCMKKNQCDFDVGVHRFGLFSNGMQPG